LTRASSINSPILVGLKVAKGGPRANEWNLLLLLLLIARI
jgi:hypothetical protein